jgi:beta-glucanase (GH16 family)
MRTGDDADGHSLRHARQGVNLWLLAGTLLAVGVVVIATFAARSFIERSTQTQRPALTPAKPVTPKPTAQNGPRPMGIAGSWKLVLNAGFKGRVLDTSLWRPTWFGSGITGPINQNELACYSPLNVNLPGDNSVHLAVTATPSQCRGGRRPYTGAVLSTNPHDGRSSGGFSYTYGALQARVYVPNSGSLVANWPAVITLGQVWPRDGEDDILENLGGVICSHFHSPGYAPGGTLGRCDPGFTPGWHTVAANWEPGSITWYYDGVEIAHFTKGVTSAPMYIVLVNTVSAKSLNVARPATMRVDYVRV